MTEPTWVAALRRAPASDDHRLRVLIAGSRALPKSSAPRLLLSFMAELPEDAIVLVRGRADGKMGDFERDVRDLCRIMELDHQICAPWPILPLPLLPDGDGENPYVGREGVLLRDRMMVDLADVVLGFVEDWQMERAEFSGTRHIVETAFARDKTTFLYSLGQHGEVTQVGQNDPLQAWTKKVP